MLLANYSRLLFGSSVALVSLGTLLSYVPQAKALDITFDYTYDDNNFFTGANVGRQALLNQAAASFTGFADRLSPVPALDYTIRDPRSPETNTVTVNRTLGQDEIIVFVGSDPNLSSIGRGGSLWSGGSSLRGQTGAPATEVEPLVGYISFDDDANWHFGTTTTGLAGKNDFLSTATHELAHVMGFGIVPSWDNLISGTEFTGTKSQSIFGGNVPLDPGLGHWANGTQSTALGVSGEIEVALDPVLAVGERRLLTDLDYAGLEDIGWEVNSSVYSTSSSVPFEFSPSLGLVVIAGMFGTKKVWNNRKTKQPALK